uniref:Uncharacterized protein n=1 Tax=Globodera rostochiensis TaxID=31243 RepID=A0A914HXM6_GLORO
MVNDDNGSCAKESPPVCPADNAGGGVDGGGSSGGENGGGNAKNRPNFGLELSGSKDGSPPSTSKLSFNNVVGYARSRLFPNSDQLAVAGKDPTSSSNSALPQAQSARDTPNKTTKRWTTAGAIGREGSNKSCPVGRRQWTASKGGEESQRLQRESCSLGGSRESVGEERLPEGGGTETVSTIAGGDPSVSRRLSLQQQQKTNNNGTEKEHWQLFAITLQRASQSGFGIAISGGPSQGSAILVSDVIKSGPAFGLLQVGDRIISVNGCPLEQADYASAVAVMKDAQQLNMIVKRRVPVPFVEFEQRTLKFTLSKSRKKDDFGIVLGCKFFIKEILNPKLAEKEPGLKEGDTVLRVNGQTLEGVTLDEASRLLQRSREKLSLVVQRDVRRGAAGSRWPSQTTVYERLGSVQATPRQSPTPVQYVQNAAEGQFVAAGAFGRKCSSGSEGYLPGGFKRYSDPNTVSGNYTPPAQFPPQSQPSQNSCQQSPYLHQQRLAVHAASTPPARPQSQTPSSVHSLNNTAVHHHQQQPFIPPTAATNNSEQQKLLADHQRMFAFQQQQFNPNPPISTFQPRKPHEMHSITFHKGSSGLGIRVIGGNQSGIFVSAVQDNSPADQNGIRVGDRIHAVNGLSMVGVTREEAFEFLLSTGEQPICMTVEHLSEEYSQVKAGKFGDNFYVRTHFAHKPERGGVGGRHVQAVQQPELAFLSGDIFHVTDTLFGGSPGYWQVAKVYSAADAEPKGGVTEPGAGVIPHAKAAETLLARQRQAEKANGGGTESPPQMGGGGGTLGRNLFRKKLSLSSRKFFGGDHSVAEDVLSAGSGTGNYASELLAPAYERVALKRPAFHRPVVLYGPLADVARQLLLSKFPLRFGAPFPHSPSVNNAVDPLSASTSSDSPQRSIPLAAVDAVMAAQKHCVMSVSAASVERLQLAQYAPIVILIDVESRSRVRELRSKAGANTNSSRKLLEQSQRIKKQHQHMLTATLDASKEDQWFDALRQLIFHLQERRVWMPEFSPECPLDDLLLFPIQQPGETPTSDSAGPAHRMPKGEAGPFLVPNPMYTLNLKQQHFGGVPLPIHHQMSSSIGSESEHQHRPRQQPLYCSNSRQSEPPPPFHALPSGSARNSPFPPPEQQQHSVYNHSQQIRSSPMEAKSQLLAQLATELGSPVQQQQQN